MNTEAIIEGGCLCSDVRWRAIGQPLYSYHCHCRMCQKMSGAAFITGSTYRFDAVEWTRGTPSHFDSSENAKRLFCSRCGSTIGWQWLEEKISLFAGSFDHPEYIEASRHVFTESQLPWVKLDDGLPRDQRYPESIDDQDQGI
jgi:hypothetical protein